MSKITIQGSFTVKNMQQGDHNQQINISDNQEIDWLFLSKEFERYQQLPLTKDIQKAIEKQEKRSFKKALTEFLTSYGVNVLSDLSSCAILEIFKIMFINGA